jgi:hypothetical protein
VIGSFAILVQVMIGLDTGSNYTLALIRICFDSPSPSLDGFAFDKFIDLHW